jgi:hypothetical protein
VSAGSDTLEEPNRAEHWDFFTPITGTRHLEVDVIGILADCGLDETATIGAVLHWSSSSTSLRGNSTVRQIQGPEVTVSVKLEGEDLGGTLRLDCQVILMGSPTSTVARAPHRPGSILWSDGTTIVLEGQSPRFPIQVVDFDRAGIAGGSAAAWFLQWRPTDLEAPTLGTLRLMLNRRHPMVSRLVAEGAAAPELAAVQSALRHDVSRQLIEGALENPEFDRETDYGPGMVGTALQGLLDSTFGTEPLDVIRGLRRTSPPDFEVRLQAASRLFSDGGP